MKHSIAIILHSDILGLVEYQDKFMIQENLFRQLVNLGNQSKVFAIRFLAMQVFGRGFLCRIAAIVF